MAETPSKRLRQEPHATDTFDFDDSNSNSKRQKPYNTILSSLLDEDEENEEHNQDFSAIFTALQQELSSSTASAASFNFTSPPLTAEEDQQACEEGEGVMSVMRHLLEASDDELGIPNNTEGDYNNLETKSEENIALNFFDNGLWEFEDVAANYYTVLQSELFM